MGFLGLQSRVRFSTVTAQSMLGPHPCGFLWRILTRDTVTVAVTACRGPRHDEEWGTGGSAHPAASGLGVRAWCLRSRLPHPGPPLGEPVPRWSL